MERAQAVCTKKMCVLQREVDDLQLMVEVYLQCNISSLLAQPAKFCELLLTAMNSGLKDGMTNLATQGDVLHGTHPFAVSASGTDLPFSTMSSTRPTKMVEEGTGTSVVERMTFCRQTSGETAGPS